jgi:hypothetical protein
MSEDMRILLALFAAALAGWAIGFLMRGVADSADALDFQEGPSKGGQNRHPPTVPRPEPPKSQGLFSAPIFMTEDLLDDNRCASNLSREEFAQALANVMRRDVLLWNQEAGKFLPFAKPEEA